ncbi:hypothetical protein SDC9_84167 [bioreactor metagenome]|uniref:Uncharacterized protein n=1 Tax=bioreactor metagenome TaxID=1076179 RepID=A0A644ZA24_9ZZZZ
MQVRLQIGGQLVRVAPAHLGGVFLDEEVERIDDRHVGDQIDGELKLVDRLGEDQPGQVVAERVLLPVDEMVPGHHTQRIGLDRGPGVRSRSQPHGVRIHGGRPIEPVCRLMLEGDADRHRFRI